jgi:AraC-like DNA-binding protein
MESAGAGLAIPYRELRPSPQWARTVECFWTVQTDAAPLHRVTPDGCADIVFYAGPAAKLTAVGAMTEYRDFALPENQVLIGARFRPGMWRRHLGIPADRITDEVLPLESLWGSRATLLLERLSEASTIRECAGLIEAQLETQGGLSPVQQAIAWMERRHGCVRLDWLASQCGLSARQFRRVCREQAGLTPKFLARVLRFRRALLRLPRKTESFAEMALDCGYYDQAHFINDFRAFAGRTPAA